MAGLRIITEGRVSVVTVNRPEVLNALDTALLEELLATLQDLGGDLPDLFRSYRNHAFTGEFPIASLNISRSNPSLRIRKS